MHEKHISFFPCNIQYIFFLQKQMMGQWHLYSNVCFLVEIQSLCIPLLSDSNYFDLRLLNKISSTDQMNISLDGGGKVQVCIASAFMI